MSLFVGAGNSYILTGVMIVLIFFFIMIFKDLLNKNR